MFLFFFHHYKTMSDQSYVNERLVASAYTSIRESEYVYT